jgi:hypothetical protein
MSDLGCEVTQEVEVESGFLQSVVEPEGLDGESSEACVAAKALDGAAIALAAEVAVQAETEAPT